MLLLGLTALVGAGIGLLLPRQGSHTSRPRLHAPGVLVAGVLLQVGAVLLDGDLAPVALAASLGVLAFFAACNRHITGVAVIGVGLLANLTAVVLHGGMPVRGEALVRAGVTERQELPVLDLGNLRHLETSRDVLPVLGDVLPIPAVAQVVSFGDLILLVGLADTSAQLARRRRRPGASRVVGQVSPPVRDTTHASADQVWGTAPSAVAVSGSQCSAKPEASAPATSIDLRAAAVSEEPDLTAASHSR